MSALGSLREVGFDLATLVAGEIESRSPIDGHVLGRVSRTSRADYDAAVARSTVAFASWRSVPAPRRGELVRLFGEAVRRHKPALAEVITLEVGKITSEALGEVQEVIDICDRLGIAMVVTGMRHFKH